MQRRNPSYQTDYRPKASVTAAAVLVICLTAGGCLGSGRSSSTYGGETVRQSVVGEAVMTTEVLVRRDLHDVDRDFPLTHERFFLLDPYDEDFVDVVFEFAFGMLVEGFRPDEATVTVDLRERPWVSGARRTGVANQWKSVMLQGHRTPARTACKPACGTATTGLPSVQGRTTRDPGTRVQDGLIESPVLRDR